MCITRFSVNFVLHNYDVKWPNLSSPDNAKGKTINLTVSFLLSSDEVFILSSAPASYFPTQRTEWVGTLGKKFTSVTPHPTLWTLVEQTRKDAKSVSSFSVSDRQWPVNLKKAGMASRIIVMKKQCTLFWISFAVVFGLLVFGCLYFGWSYISFLEIQRLQLAGFSSTVFAVNLFPFYGVCYRRLPEPALT